MLLSPTGSYVPRPWKGTSPPNGVLSDRELFQRLGFDDLLALDANAYEEPDVVHDLNRADIAPALAGQFDLVFDGGTLEHVFDVANALRIICRFTKPGGRVVHVSPLSNCVDHGFYCFSPTLFVDFYSANNWIIRRLAVARFDRDPVSDAWEIQEYRPGKFAQLGALPPGTYFLLTCVESKSDSTFAVIPQQSHYSQVWKDAPPSASID